MLEKNFSQKNVLQPLNMEIDTRNEEKCEDTAVRRARLFKQFLMVFCASLCYWSVGMSFAFPSVLSSDLDHHNTTLFQTHISLTETQRDFVGALIPIGGFIGSWVAGFTSARFGRRFSLFMVAADYVFAWIGTTLAPSATLFLIIRFFNGFGCGSSMVTITTYVVELSDHDVRGKMLAIPQISQMAGQLLAALLGYHIRYFYVSLIGAIFPAIMLIGCFYLPETPSYLVLKGENIKATENLKRLRSSKVNVNAEIEKLHEMNSTTKDGGWSSLLQKDVFKRLVVIFFLFFFNVFSGTTVLVFFASRIMKTSGSSINEELCTVILMLVQLISVFFMGPLMDCLGRKKTLVGSFIVMGLSLGTLTCYTWLTEGLDTNHPFVSAYGWIPLASLIVCLMAASVGATPIPFIIAGEYFPTSIRSQTSAVWMSARTGFTFLSLQLYSPMIWALTPKGLYGFYGLVCLLGVPYVLLLVEETKGKNVG